MLAICVWMLCFWVGLLVACDQEVSAVSSQAQASSRRVLTNDPGEFVSSEMRFGRRSFVDLSRFVRNQDLNIWQPQHWDVLNQLVNWGVQQVRSAQSYITMVEDYDKLLKLVDYMSFLVWLSPDQAASFPARYKDLKDIYFFVVGRLESVLSYAQGDLSLVDFRRHCFLLASYLSMFVSHDLVQKDKVFCDLAHRQVDRLIPLVDFQCFDCDLNEYLESVRPKDKWLVEAMWNTCQERKSSSGSGS